VKWINKYLAVKVTVLSLIRFLQSDVSRKFQATYEPHANGIYVPTIPQRDIILSSTYNAPGSSRGWLEWSTGADKHFHRLLSISLFRWYKMRVSSQGYESDARLPAWCVSPWTTGGIMVANHALAGQTRGSESPIDKESPKIHSEK